MLIFCDDTKFTLLLRLLVMKGGGGRGGEGGAGSGGDRRKDKSACKIEKGDKNGLKFWGREGNCVQNGTNEGVEA